MKYRPSTLGNSPAGQRVGSRWVVRLAIGTLAATAFVFSALLPTRAATRVSPSVLMAAAIRRVVPAYNQAAKTMRAQGQVEIEVTVDEEGNVKSAQAISGHALLRENAKAAASQWRFDAKKLSDPPGAVVGIIVFTFKLES